MQNIFSSSGHILFDFRNPFVKQRDIELGNKNPTIEFLSYICEALNISLKDFFDDETSSLLDDPLICRIYQLSPKQKDALLTFLNTLMPSDN